MEDFASEVAEAGTAESIAQMFDQYLNFIVSEPDLFSLGMGKETYWALNSNNVKDEEIDDLVDKAVGGLFSVTVTMGTFCTLVKACSIADIINRFYSHNSKSARGACRNDSCKIGP